MDGGFAFLDILIFAMIAAFLVLRLRNVLGRRTGNEQRREDSVYRPKPAAQSGDNVVQLPDRSGVEPAMPKTGVEAALAQIKIADPRFDEGQFATGARSAFEMIVNAFSAGDRDTLRALTGGEVLANLEAALDDREAKGHELATTIVGVKRVEIADAQMMGSEARVTMRFVSEQINVTRDAEGEIVSGGEAAVHEVIDVWTFARDTRSSDPNWTLIETRPPE